MRSVLIPNFELLIKLSEDDKDKNGDLEEGEKKENFIIKIGNSLEEKFQCFRLD